MRDTRQLLPLLPLLLLLLTEEYQKHLPGTKTARHGRTNRPQNRTEKVPNVTSETHRKIMILATFFCCY